MIVIFSYPGDDNTNKVIEWLKFYKCPFKRVHLKEEDYRNIEVKISTATDSCSLKLQNDESLDLQQIAYFFVRGGGFLKKEIENTTILPPLVFDVYLHKEYTTLVDYFYAKVNDNSIGRLENEDLNKLVQLRAARNAGLDICDTMVVTKLQRLEEYFQQKQLITKAIQENIAFETEKHMYLQKVQRVNYEELDESFYPSLFQEEVGKAFEIRTFYLDGRCYSIAIFTPNHKVDMRESFRESRFEPYQLPLEVASKIAVLMDKLQLISGSVDLIKGTNGKIYFLEVNPNGQYDWVSVFGGYHLHREIALFLLKKNVENAPEVPEMKNLT